MTYPRSQVINELNLYSNQYDHQHISTFNILKAISTASNLNILKSALDTYILQFSNESFFLVSYTIQEFLKIQLSNSIIHLLSVP